MQKTSKPMIKSMGILGSIGSLTALLALVNEIRVFIANNPELIDETRVQVLALIAAIGGFISFVGRWRAKLPIKGVWRQK